MSWDHATDWDRDLRIGEYRGFRAWTMRGPWSPLRSLSWSFDWQDGINESRCLKTRGWRSDPEAQDRCNRTHPDTPVHLTTCFKEPFHTKPTAGCGCGFWAYFDRQFWQASDSRVQIFGVVRGWGTCRVGRKGFRAQYAQIEALAIAPAEANAYHTFEQVIEQDVTTKQEVLTNLMQRYPSAEVYPSIDMMLSRHSLTEGKHGE